ncbi:hypothetical protein ACET3Z_002386 [Daucus carota]
MRKEAEESHGFPIHSDQTSLKALNYSTKTLMPGRRNSHRTRPELIRIARIIFRTCSWLSKNSQQIWRAI